VDLRSGALASIFCRCTLLVLKLTTAACLLKDDDLCKASKGLEHGIALIVTRHQGLIIIDELVHVDQMPLKFLLQYRLWLQRVQFFDLLISSHNRSNLFYPCHHCRVLFQVVGSYLVSDLYR
jgi:hypothetical protein